MPHEVKIGMITCSPIPFKRGANGKLIHEPVTIQWHRKRMALSHPTNFSNIEVFADGLEVGDARNRVIKTALEYDNTPEFVFFLDYDVLPEFDALTKLIYRARHFPDYDVFAGVYCCKGMNPPDPLIYAGDGGGPFWDWAIGDLLTTEEHGITGTHMGLTLIRTSLFKKWPWDEEDPWFKTHAKRSVDDDGCHRIIRGTEDLFFYKRAREKNIDIKIMVDTSVIAAHIDINTGIEWGLPPDCDPVKRAQWMPVGNDAPQDSKEEKIALDLGAGETRREWTGHRTYTTDLRPGIDVDYVQDSRHLNLPDNHFDLVASSHHLEHIPRMEQELVWKEVFRVCKPGGKIEHIVPSIHWAAAKICENKEEGYTNIMNVLYGGQEACGFERNLNLHYFGYTKKIAKVLAESVGFVDIECEDWNDEALNGFNLIIRGRKPEVGEKISDDKKKLQSSPEKNGKHKKLPSMTSRMKPKKKLPSMTSRMKPKKKLPSMTSRMKPKKKVTKKKVITSNRLPKKTAKKKKRARSKTQKR